jgi:PIN domain nuclease of toxin-antitoxin system
MRLLLDTHIFLWAVTDNSLLKTPARRIMEGAEQVFVSAASIWEIAIKSRLGKIDGDPDELVRAIETSGFMELPVRAVHAAGVANLPLHHADPFDRLLIAQALSEPLKLLTVDPVLTQYSDLVVRA